MRYIPSILTAFIGVCLLIDGVGKRLGAGLCDQCSGDQGPGNRLLAGGAGLLIASMVLLICTLVFTAAREGQADRDDG